jgi:hypothetical protein
MFCISRRHIILLAALLSVGPEASLAADDRHAIIHLMKGMFDTPENPLRVDPIVIVGDNAIAGWIQGDKGGRALLWRADGEWQIRLCSGDGLKDQALLESAQVSPSEAKALLASLEMAEGKLDPAVTARFSLFEGTMMMEPGPGNHGHGHGAGTGG